MEGKPTLATTDNVADRSLSPTGPAPRRPSNQGRALSHRTVLSEPRDLVRVEASSDQPSLNTLREALEGVIGVKFEGERGVAFLDRRWCKRSSTPSSPPRRWGLDANRSP